MKPRLTDCKMSLPGFGPSKDQARREPHRGPGKHSRGASKEKICDFFLKLRILMYCIFLSDGGAPKRCGARGNFPFYTPLSTGLVKMHPIHSNTCADNQCLQKNFCPKMASVPSQKVTLYAEGCVGLLLLPEANVTPRRVFTRSFQPFKLF